MECGSFKHKVQPKYLGGKNKQKKINKKRSSYTKMFEEKLNTQNGIHYVSFTEQLLC